MWLIIGSLFILSMILVLIAALLIFKNLPNPKERLKFILPLLLVIVVIAVCYLFKWHMPTGEIGKFI